MYAYECNRMAFFLPRVGCSYTNYGRNKNAQPYNNVMIGTSSFSPAASASPNSASAFIFPSFKYMPSILAGASSPPPSRTSDVDMSTLARAMLLPRELHPAHAELPESTRLQMTRDSELLSKLTNIVDIKYSPTILICGHGGRDMRCGLMGPVLEAEFQRALQRRGFTTDTTASHLVDGLNRATIGLISHIGGHKYAGNVIIYIPPGMTTSSSSPSPLAGKGIWYGRLEPKHVEGIVEETILHGRVVADHFRGGIGINGEIYRL
jgi:hypothetical protein